ncbi:DNA cytosine methyltransferase [Novosphingobium sp. BL-8A]|uniref:DNA cytosine methyltransferase n=1 Tax=Novosphingobium sp. BL-8A TaxID=3127639 RepID=UPI00375636C2
MGLIVDNFAGGGGASTGIEAALGRAVDIAINHDEEAIRMHEVNHPGTLHIRNNIWQIDPKEVTGGQPVDLAWFSPDCKHFSKAKGGKPREKSIRDLAWVVVLWAQRVRPSLILLENVEEFRTWGPLCDQGMPIKERAGETFEKWQRELRKAGYKIQWKELRACDYGAPTIRKRFFMIARCDGKPIVWPKPTHGKPGSPEVLSGKRKPWRTAAEIIDWSIPCPSIFERKKPLADKTLRRIAHGIMKFVVNNPAPFIVPLTHHQRGARGASVDQPMATVTGANRGEHAIIMPHVTKFRSGAIGHAADEPLHTVTANSFIKRPGGSVPLGVVEVAAAPFATYAQQGGANRSLEDPHHTVTASNKDQNCVATAHLVHIGNGERQGQAPRAMDVQAPLGTVVAGGTKHHAVTAFMQKFAQNGQGYDPADPLHTVMAGAPRHAVICAHVEQANGGPNNENLAGRPADAPLSTVATSGSQQRLVTSNLVKLRGTCRDGQGVDEPLHTVSAGGTHMGEVRAFLLKYYGTDQDPQLGEPLHTVTTKDRYGLVTVMIEGEEYVIVDIGMRMLSPRELFNAQGFPADYKIEFDAHGKPITKTAQVAKCGNSVCPPLSEALVRANMADEIAEREAQAA